MNKKKFLRSLKWQLRGMPKEETRETLDYYDEIISDHMADGLDEESAVAAVGDAKQIAAQLREEAAQEKPEKKKGVRRGWPIALIIIGSVIWVPLLIVALVLTLVFYVVLWVLVLVLAVLTIAMAVAALGSVAGIVLAVRYGVWQMIPLFIGALLLAAGFTILLFLATFFAAKGVAKLGPAMIRGFRNSLTGRRDKK